MKHLKNIILFLIITILISCGDDKDSTNTLVHGGYNIEFNDSNDKQIKLFVYINNTSKLNEVNSLLFKTYNSDSSKWINIFYFDKEGYSIKYLESIQVDTLNDSEWTKKYSKYSEYCNFTYNPLKKTQDFEYPKK